MMCLYKGHRLLAVAFTFHFILQEDMAPPATPKTASKGSKKIISKQSKGTRTASKAGASVEKKTHKRKRKSQSIVF